MSFCIQKLKMKIWQGTWYVCIILGTVNYYPFSWNLDPPVTQYWQASTIFNTPIELSIQFKSGPSSNTMLKLLSSWIVYFFVNFGAPLPSITAPQWSAHWRTSQVFWEAKMADCQKPIPWGNAPLLHYKQKMGTEENLRQFPFSSVAIKWPSEMCWKNDDPAPWTRDITMPNRDA